MKTMRVHSRRGFLGTSLGLAAVTGAVRSTWSSAYAQQAYTLRMSLPVPEHTGWFVASAQWARAVARRSNGRLTMELYPNGQIATGDGSIQALLSGTLDLTENNGIVVQPLVPQFAVMDLPFMFRDSAAAYRVVDGPIGKELFAQLDAKGIIGFFWGSSGFRMIATTTKSIRSPEDMKGLRIRIAGGQVYVALMQTLGAIPITIDGTEQYTALMQHTIDGIENTIEQVLDQKLYNATKHVCLTHHVFSMQPLMGSKKKIEAMPKDLQKILWEEAQAIKPVVRSLGAQREADDIRQLKELGVEFTEGNFAAFRKAVLPVYSQFESKIGADLIQRVSRAAGSA